MAQDRSNSIAPKAPNQLCLTQDKLASLGTERLAQILTEEIKANIELRERLHQLIAELTGDGSDSEEIQATGEPHMVGNSPPMIEAFRAIRKMAVTDAPILITGESGTGKELAALAVHERSSFRNGPFVAVNCAGMPATLIASELFGHEKGSFTGAYQRQIGRIESAQHGTLFLDEIGDLPLDLQVHLLRFLQEKKIERVGGHRTIKIDTRIIAATHENLESAMAKGRFRADLFYRLNVLRFQMPVLRERGDDVELLSTYFLRKFGGEMNRALIGFQPGALKAILDYDWPGNVRELISSIRRAVVMSEGDWISAEHLGIPNSGSENEQSMFGDDDRLPDDWDGHGHGSSVSYARAPTRPRDRMGLDALEIVEALKAHHHNVSRAAKHLGVSRVTLYRHMRRHHIQPHPNK